MLTTKSAQFAPLWISRGKRATPESGYLFPPSADCPADCDDYHVGPHRGARRTPLRIIRLPAKHAVFFLNFILVVRNASRSIKNLEDLLETEADVENSICLLKCRRYGRMANRHPELFDVLAAVGVLYWQKRNVRTRSASSGFADGMKRPRDYMPRATGGFPPPPTRLCVFQRLPTLARPSAIKAWSAKAKCSGLRARAARNARPRCWVSDFRVSN